MVMRAVALGFGVVAGGGGGGEEGHPKPETLNFSNHPRLRRIGPYRDQTGDRTSHLPWVWDMRVWGLELPLHIRFYIGLPV